MEIYLTQAEINSLLEQFVPKNPQIFFTGTNSFDVKAEIKFGFRKTISCRVDHFSERSITISYELNAIFNQLAKWFGELNKQGIAWDKENQKIHIDPLAMLKKNIPNLPIDILIREFSIKEGKLKIEFSPTINS